MNIKTPVHEGWTSIAGGPPVLSRWAIAGEIMAANPDVDFSRQMTPAEKQADLESEIQARSAELAAAKRQPDNDPSKIYAQVVVDGKVVATIYKSGGVESEGSLPNLTSDGSPLSIAKARVKEITQFAHGEVRYSDFLPNMAERSAPDIKNSVLEAARSRVDALQQVLQALFQDLAHTRLNLSTPVESTASEQKSV